MIRVCHVFDETTGWEQRVGVWQLLDRLPRDRYEQRLVSLHPRARASLGSLETDIESVPRPVPLDFVSAPLLRRVLQRTDVDVIHAWGTRAAFIASVATDTPVVVELFDPARAAGDARTIRAIARSIGLGVLCNSERLRRRLTECGVPLEGSTVVRPGVDFAQISRVQRSGLREKLGLNRGAFAIVLSDPITQASGSLDAAVGIAIVNQIRKNARILLCSSSPEADRITRFASLFPLPQPMCPACDDEPTENLIAIADAIVIASPGDISTTATAWAMASSTAIVGSATYAVAELIGSGLNGMLFKRAEDRPPSVAIARLLMDRTKQDKMKEVARGHAYEVFSIRRRLDQIVQVYENVIKGVPIGEGIIDSAIAV